MNIIWITSRNERKIYNLTTDIGGERFHMFLQYDKEPGLSRNHFVHLALDKKDAEEMVWKLNEYLAIRNQIN